MSEPLPPRRDPAAIGDALRRSFDGRDPDAMQPELVRLMLQLSHDRPTIAAIDPTPAASVTPQRVARSWWSRALLAVRR